jgi:hypothetical protein
MIQALMIMNQNMIYIAAAAMQLLQCSCCNAAFLKINS